MASRIQMLLCGFLFLASAAHADPITVTFTAFPVPNDPVNAGPSTGTFTFDSSLLPPGGGQIQNSTFGLGATDVNFQWGSTLFTRANAHLGELQFNAAGELLVWVPGGTQSPTGPQTRHPRALSLRAMSVSATNAALLHGDAVQRAVCRPSVPTAEALPFVHLRRSNILCVDAARISTDRRAG